MTQTMLANIIYVLGAIALFAAEHFGWLPSGTANLLLAALGGSAVTTGTLIPTKGAPVVSPKSASNPGGNQAVNDPGTQG